METYKLTNGKTLQVIQDNNPDSPREWDNIGTMICFHGRYNLGDKHNYKHQDYSGWAEMEKAITKNESPAIILPLYLYDHGGITISTSPFGCQWDSGQIGFIFVSKEKLRKEYGVKRVTKKEIEKAEKCLIGEVKTYDDYLTGNVYGYKVIDSEGNEEDSCWGYYGEDSIKEEFKNELVSG